jgi:fructose-specific phosphotransferase system IIA component
VDRDLVVIASTATNRDEAIHELVDALYIAGRTEARTELEEAVFAREAVYSTALGFGFAIPHCKSDAVLADSIAILKVARPLAWGEEMVQFVILLAMRAAAKDNRHMQVFSQLARKLMDEEFREQLNAADNPDSVVAKLASQLSL